MERASSHSRYGAPTIPVIDADGELGRREEATGDEVGEQHDQRADEGRRADGERSVRQAAGDRGGDEGDEDDRPGGGRRQRGERHGDEHEQPGEQRSTADAEPLGRVVAELHHAQRTERGGRAGDEHDNGDEADVRTCSQPRPLRLPVSHTTARWASKISARVSRYWVTP